MLIQIIIFILLLSACCTIYWKRIEHFWYYPTNVLFCPNCKYKNRQTCKTCANCGFCQVKNGDGMCVEGDKNGAFYKKDCIAWEYGEPINTPMYAPPTQYYTSGYPRQTRNFSRYYRKNMRFDNN